MMKIKIGIIGAAGYTAGELIRILLNHPNAEICYAQSASQAGKNISDVHGDLLGESSLQFCKDIHFDVDLLFLCSGHGKGQEFMAKHQVPKRVAIIDLGNDFRLNNKEFSYGLAELMPFYPSNRIANPGCFATAMQLGLLPLAKAKSLKGKVIINGLTGSTGAGQNPSASSHFSWRNNNISNYKVFEHQHVPELEQGIKMFQEELPSIYFIPMRGNFTRGIFLNIVVENSAELTDLESLYQDFYQDQEFVVISKQDIHLKQVVNTNKTLIQLQKKDEQLLITVALDNLVKGASGQAVQNMNILYKLDPSTGLKLKAGAF